MASYMEYNIILPLNVILINIFIQIVKFPVLV